MAKDLLDFLKRQPKVFVANVFLPTPDDPCWSDGFMVAGDWKTVCKVIAAFFASCPVALSSEVRVNQGERAREMMKQNISEEMRYREEKRAQPYN